MYSQGSGDDPLPHILPAVFRAQREGDRHGGQGSKQMKEGTNGWRRLDSKAEGGGGVRAKGEYFSRDADRGQLAAQTGGGGG